MKVKKIIISLLIINFVVFVFGGYFIPPKKVNAAAPVFARIVGGSVGERVLLGVMEKQGVKFATKTAREKAVERWNMDLYKKIQDANKIGDELKAQELARFQKTLADLKAPDVKPKKNGLGEVILGGALFLTGLDLVKDFADKINDANTFDQKMESMQEIEKAIESGEYITQYGPLGYIVHDPLDIDWGIDTNGEPDPEIGGYPYNSILGFASGVVVLHYFITSVQIVEQNSKAMKVTYSKDVRWKVGANTYRQEETRSFYLNKKYYTPEAFGHKVVESVPKINELPEITPVFIPSPDTMPEEVPITIPDNLEVPFPWNEPFPEGPITETPPLPEDNVNPVPNPNPNTGTDLNPIPDTSPLPEPLPEPLPDEPLPPDSEACKSPATDLLSFFKDSLIGNFACFNWTKLKMSGAFFTNKFPFSIPWDIGRALSATFGGLTPTDEIPSYQLKIFDWEHELTIPDYFAKWFKMIRVMLLVMFDIGLVWSVRKMLGGAS